MPKKITTQKITQKDRAKVDIGDQWDEILKTEQSQNFLAAMAEKVRKNHEAGKTKRGGFGKI